MKMNEPDADSGNHKKFTVETHLFCHGVCLLRLSRTLNAVNVYRRGRNCGGWIRGRGGEGWVLSMAFLLYES